jgi:hypothetical protein
MPATASVTAEGGLGSSFPKAFRALLPEAPFRTPAGVPRRLIRPTSRKEKAGAQHSLAVARV